MDKKINVVVAGPESLVGEAVLNLLEEREFPIAEIRLVSGDAGGRVEFKGKHLKVESLEDFDFSEFKIAFFCVDEVLAEQYAPIAAAAGCVVIDDSPCFRLEDDVPLVAPEVNPDALAGYTQQNIVANPGTGPAVLATVLKPLADLGIERVNVVTMQAVSGKDKAGVEELARQSTAMFNMKTIESDVFDQQIAFNLIPLIGGLRDDGYSREEAKLAWESVRLLDQPDLAVNATCVRVPVFHGHALSVHLDISQAVDLDDMERRLNAAEGITLMQEQPPSPLADAVGQDSVFVGRLRRDMNSENGLAFWVVVDNIRRGAALNSVQSAEILLKKYLY